MLIAAAFCLWAGYRRESWHIIPAVFLVVCALNLFVVLGASGAEFEALATSAILKVMGSTIGMFIPAFGLGRLAAYLTQVYKRRGRAASKQVPTP